jgi:hypothetical protein
MTRQRALVLLMAAAAFGLLALAVSIAFPTAKVDDGGAGHPIVVALWGLSYLALGGLLVWRRPTFVIPWILVALGIDLCGSALAQAATNAQPELADRFPGVGIALFLVFGCLAGLLAHLYPTGRPPSARWAWPIRILIGSTVVLTAGQLAGIDPAVSGIPVRVLAATFTVGYAVGLVAAVPSVALRMHRAAGIERAQLKWFFFGLIAGIVGWFMSGPFAAFGAAVAALLPAAAIVIALLRYRLYDIDRVISRTASYAIVTGFVLILYFAAVTTATRLLNGAGPLVVAAATLLAAALFRPALSRVQRAIDRRFNRSKYDASRILENFGHQLRNELDADSIGTDLVMAVQETLQPALATLWVRGRDDV